MRTLEAQINAALDEFIETVRTLTGIIEEIRYHGLATRRQRK